MRESERNGDRASYRDRSDDLDPPELEGRNTVGVVPYPEPRSTRNVPDATKNQEREQAREHQERQREHVLGNRAPLALGAKSIVDLCNDVGRVHVYRCISAGSLCVVGTQRDDRGLSNEYDRAAWLLLDSSLRCVGVFELALESDTRGAPSVLNALTDSPRVKDENDALVNANLDRRDGRSGRPSRCPSKRKREGASDHADDDPTP